MKKRGYKEIKWWKDCRKLAEIILSKKAEKDKEKEARKRRSRQPKLQWTLGKSCGWFLILMGGHDMLRKVDRQGDILIWCRKCSGYARQRMGPKLMNYCKLEKIGAKECGKMLKRIQVLEDGRVPARDAKNWKIEGEKRRITRKDYRRL